MTIVIAGTGHRPDKLVPGNRQAGYTNATLAALIGLAEKELDLLQPGEVISGVALGWDTALAIAAIRRGIPLTCAVPFEGQESRWPQESQDRYNKILSKAKAVVVVSEGGYSAQSMQVRNEWMTDRAQKLLALWNGTPGGTRNCLDYAEKVAVPARNIWPLWVEVLASL
jgi:uncharacterized phage-like protein YoqJ